LSSSCEGGPEWLKEVWVDFVAHRENFSIIVTWFKIGPRILLICRTCVARVDELLARITMRAAATALELEEREKEGDMLGEAPSEGRRCNPQQRRPTRDGGFWLELPRYSISCELTQVHPA
jgi:hypothetical protein